MLGGNAFGKIHSREHLRLDECDRQPVRDGNAELSRAQQRAHSGQSEQTAVYPMRPRVEQQSGGAADSDQRNHADMKTQAQTRTARERPLASDRYRSKGWPAEQSGRPLSAVKSFERRQHTIADAGHMRAKRHEPERDD